MAASDDRKGHQGGADIIAPTPIQRAWLARGLDQPGGKLPLFNRNGQLVGARTVQSCIDRGWAERWFSNPLKPDWQVCRLTEKGRAAVQPRDAQVFRLTRIAAPAPAAAPAAERVDQETAPELR
jgi:hypothetical protein